MIMRHGGSASGGPFLSARLTSTQAASEKAAAQRHVASNSGGTSSPGGMPRASVVPQTTAWLLMTTPEALPALIQEREDLSSIHQGWWRAGDGTISVRIRSSFWKGFRTHECGGVLLVEGTAGKPARLSVRNNLDRRVELVIDWNGSDLLGGKGFPFERAGIVLAPGETKVIRTRTGTDGKPVPLEYQTIPDVKALLRHQPAYQPGVIRISSFLSAEKVSRQLRPVHAAPTKTPQYTGQPRLRDYEYR